MSPSPRKVLLFTPEAALVPHYSAMALIARTLQERGHTVHLAFCDGLFERCVVRDALQQSPGIPRQDVMRVCADCTAVARRLGKRLELEQADLATVVTPHLIYEATAAVDAAEDDELAEFRYDGIAFGPLCLQDLVLSRKVLLDRAFGVNDRRQLREYLRTTIVTHLAVKAMLVRDGYTDLVILGQYAMLSAAVLAARRLGLNWRVATFPAHRGNDRRRLVVSGLPMRENWYRCIDLWPLWRDVPLTADEVEEIWADMLVRFGARGSHSYSPAKTTRSGVLESLNLPGDRRLVVAFTSSLDERQANDVMDEVWGIRHPPRDDLAFASQMEWLRFLIDWAAGRSDAVLVIRIHPREGSNKRERRRSHHLAVLEEVLATLPPNVKVVWPGDPVSSYDLIEQADLVQSSWSTIGLEAARLGVATMTSDGFNTYPAGDFIVGGRTPEEFGRTMERLLDSPPDWDRTVLALRYYALTRLHDSIGFEDVVSHPDAAELTEFRSPHRAALLDRVLFGPAPTSELNRHGRDLSSDARAAERRVVRRLLERLIGFLMTGVAEVDGSSGPPLVLRRVDAGEIEQPVAVPDGGAVLLFDGRLCRYATSAGSVLRLSPLTARLGELLLAPEEQDGTSEPAPPHRQGAAATVVG